MGICCCLPDQQTNSKEAEALIEHVSATRQDSSSRFWAWERLRSIDLLLSPSVYR